MLGPPSAADSESAARPRRGRRGPDSRRGRCWPRVDRGLAREVQVDRSLTREVDVARGLARGLDPGPVRLCSLGGPGGRSEEHTSELQSRLHLVCRLLLEKKKKTKNSDRAGQKITKITITV